MDYPGCLNVTLKGAYEGEIGKVKVRKKKEVIIEAEVSDEL